MRVGFFDLVVCQNDYNRFHYFEHIVSTNKAKIIKIIRMMTLTPKSPKIIKLKVVQENLLSINASSDLNLKEYKIGRERGST